MKLIVVIYIVFRQYRYHNNNNIKYISQYNNADTQIKVSHSAGLYICALYGTFICEPVIF